MEIAINALEKLEKLSMIKIDDDKKDEMKKSLEDIIDFMDNLSSLDTSNVDDSRFFHTKETPLREDEINQSFVFNDVLENAPQTADNLFIVPKIIG